MKTNEPQLSHVALAETYSLDDLRSHSVKACAELLSPTVIESQRSEPGSQSLPDASLLEIYK